MLHVRPLLSTQLSIPVGLLSEVRIVIAVTETRQPPTKPDVDLEGEIQRASEESNRIMVQTRRRGVVLKLIGGLAVHSHCSVHDFCDRSYADLDFIGLRSQYEQLVQVMKDLGYAENTNMTLSTSGSRLLFERKGAKKHIDVFMDSVDIEHRVVLKDRLDIESSTISVSDLLLLKLAITRLNEKDMRDIITLLKDLTIGHDDSQNIINVDYIAGLCARKWGLYHDVLASLQKVAKYLQTYPLQESSQLDVAKKLGTLRDMIISMPKALSWKLRALLGEKIPWKREIESTNVLVDTSLDDSVHQKA
jgi:hypothetical protein